MRFTIALALVVLTTLTFKSNAFGQKPDGGSVEFAMLGGINLLTYETSYDDADAELYVTIPNGQSAFPLTPMLRMSVWTKSLLILDFGFSSFYTTVDDGSRVTNIEVGIGAVFGNRDSRTFPSVSILLGAFSRSNDYSDADREGYFGFQGGIRHFFRKHAAMRMQLAYRSFPDDDLRLKSSWELAGGLSFLI